MTTRRPAVAGLFYPAHADEIDAALARLVPDVRPRVAARAVVVPHAAWPYSGAVAGEVYGRIDVPRRVVVLGPDHRRRGPGISVMARGRWALPGGAVPIDEALADALLAGGSTLVEDESGHRDEHAIEVQLPFLRRRRPDVAFVPVALWHEDAGACREAGQALAAAVTAAGEAVLLVCSTDLDHYEPHAITVEKDGYAIEAILALDPDGLAAAVRRHDISMCGVAATLVTLHALVELGAARATLVRHATSGEVSGDYDAVVGYAGIVVP